MRPFTMTRGEGTKTEWITIIAVQERLILYIDNENKINRASYIAINEDGWRYHK